jgi:hypothetical protein
VLFHATPIKRRRIDYRGIGSPGGRDVLIAIRSACIGFLDSIPNFTHGDVAPAMGNRRVNRLGRVIRGNVREGREIGRTQQPSMATAAAGCWGL